MVCTSLACIPTYIYDTVNVLTNDSKALMYDCEESLSACNFTLKVRIGYVASVASSLPTELAMKIYQKPFCEKFFLIVS